jgi:signal transduction histidine kinase
VIVNLLNNASEAMVGKGENSSQQVTASPRIAVITRLAARGVEITVADNGPGMTEEVMAKVLEPLFTTKNFGTGLGLPAVEKIAEQHGGGLSMASRPGAGANFTVWIPLDQSQKEAA